MDKQHHTNKSIIHNTPNNGEAQITSTQMHTYQQLVINQKNMTHMCITKGGHWQSAIEHTHTQIPNNRISREYKCTTGTMTRLNDYNNNNKTTLGNTKFN